MEKKQNFAGFPYTLCLILFLNYILRAESMRDIIIFLLLRNSEVLNLVFSFSKKQGKSGLQSFKVNIHFFIQ